MHYSNDDRQEFLDAVEGRVHGRGSADALRRLAEKLRDCSDIIPSAYRDILHEMIGGEAPPFTFAEASNGLTAALAA